MKVAILGDLFVTNEVLRAAFEKSFKDSGLSFEYVTQTDTWPVTPVMKTDEISEFVGEENEVLKIISDIEIVLTHTAPLTKKVIDAARKLKIVGAARGGPVNINWTACTEHGIPVLYAPGRNSGAVAEYTVGMMLAQSRNITRSHMSLMIEKRWRGDLYTQEVVGNELNSSVVGLIGSGAIGSKVARLVQAFGAKVLVYDPFIPAEKIRAMDCVDCHNRPTHVLTAPDRSADEALYDGRLDASLPFIKQQSVAALVANYASRDAAAKGIEAELRGYYQKNYPPVYAAKQKAILNAVRTLRDIHDASFFPAMKVQWSTYPTNDTHFYSVGCSRCHDGQHKSVDGSLIRSDCGTCHTILRQGPPDKLQSAQGLEGLPFTHPVDIGTTWAEQSCTTCHSGGPM